MKSEPHIVSDPNTPEAKKYAEDYWNRRMQLPVPNRQKPLKQPVKKKPRG